MVVDLPRWKSRLGSVQNPGGKTVGGFTTKCQKEPRGKMHLEFLPSKFMVYVCLCHFQHPRKIARRKRNSGWKIVSKRWIPGWGFKALGNTSKKLGLASSNIIKLWPYLDWEDQKGCVQVEGADFIRKMLSKTVGCWFSKTPPFCNPPKPSSGPPDTCTKRTGGGGNVVVVVQVDVLVVLVLVTTWWVEHGKYAGTWNCDMKRCENHQTMKLHVKNHVIAMFKKHLKKKNIEKQSELELCWNINEQIWKAKAPVEHHWRIQAVVMKDEFMLSIYIIKCLTVMSVSHDGSFDSSFTCRHL